MVIGQIVYDLVGVNGYTSTNKNDVTTVVTGPQKNANPYAANKISITSDLVAKVGSGSWSKVGIQAPSGTTFYLNNRLFYMGNTEVFELDETTIQITSLYFTDSNVENIIVDYLIRG